MMLLKTSSKKNLKINPSWKGKSSDPPWLWLPAISFREQTIFHPDVASGIIVWPLKIIHPNLCNTVEKQLCTCNKYVPTLSTVDLPMPMLFCSLQCFPKLVWDNQTQSNASNILCKWYTHCQHRTVLPPRISHKELSNKAWNQNHPKATTPARWVKWLSKWVTGGITLLIRLITPYLKLKTSRGPLCVTKTVDTVFTVHPLCCKLSSEFFP